MKKHYYQEDGREPTTLEIVISLVFVILLCIDWDRTLDNLLK